MSRFYWATDFIIILGLLDCDHCNHRLHYVDFIVHIPLCRFFSVDSFIQIQYANSSFGFRQDCFIWSLCKVKIDGEVWCLVWIKPIYICHSNCSLKDRLFLPKYLLYGKYAQYSENITSKFLAFLRFKGNKRLIARL